LKLRLNSSDNSNNVEVSDVPDVPPPVILIEPISDNVNPAAKFFGNDIAMSRGIKSSLFGQAIITEISKNINRQIVTVKLDKRSSDMVPDLLKVDNIGSWKVACRLPRAKTATYGVIGPLGQDVTDDEVMMSLRESGCQISSATRITKGSAKVKTAMFKIAFDLPQLPDVVVLGYQRFHVKLYIDTPWQCYKCQRFGHSASVCKGKQKCVV
jgi:hypothetical protein